MTISPEGADGDLDDRVRGREFVQVGILGSCSRGAHGLGASPRRTLASARADCGPRGRAPCQRRASDEPAIRARSRAPSPSPSPTPASAQAARTTPECVTQSTGGSRARRPASAAPTRAASIATLSPPCGRAPWKSAAQASSSARGSASQAPPLPGAEVHLGEPRVLAELEPARRGDRLGEHGGSGRAGSTPPAPPAAAPPRSPRPPRREVRAGRDLAAAVADPVGRRRPGVAQQDQRHASTPR